MGYFDDMISGGLCCQSCGEFMGGDEPGFPRTCAGCAPQAAPISLQSALRSSHERKRIGCPKCRKRFATTADLVQHIQQVHLNKETR